MNALVVSSIKSFPDRKYCDALRDLVSFAQFKKHENTCGGVLLLVKLQAKQYSQGTLK